MVGKISMQNHLAELAGGVHLLADRTDVNPDRIFALTNSEGCIHALNYQIGDGSPRFAGLVLTSAPARPVGVIGRSQIAAQLAGVAGGDQTLATYDDAIRQFTSGGQVDISESLPEGVRLLLKSLASPVNQPFSRELWVADVSQLLRQVDVPVLIVLGKKDVQVNWQSDGEIFDEIVKEKPNAQVTYMRTQIMC